MDQTPEEHWRDLSERLLTEISEWQRSYPKATSREIEDEAHQRMSRLEAQLIRGYGAAECESKLERSELPGTSNVLTVGSFGLRLACSPSLFACCCYSCACVPLLPNLTLLSLLTTVQALTPPYLVLVLLLLIIPGSDLLLVVRSWLQ
jgi:hypothetical protein